MKYFRYIQVSFDPTLATQVTPLYISDPTLFAVESTQTTDDLKNHAKSNNITDSLSNISTEVKQADLV